MPPYCVVVIVDPAKAIFRDGFENVRRNRNVQPFVPAAALGQADLQDHTTQLAQPQLNEGAVLSDID